MLEKNQAQFELSKEAKMDASNQGDYSRITNEVSKAIEKEKLGLTPTPTPGHRDPDKKSGGVLTGGDSRISRYGAVREVTPTGNDEKSYTPNADSKT